MDQHISDDQFWDLPDEPRYHFFSWLVGHGYGGMGGSYTHRATVGHLLEFLDDFGYVEIIPNFSIGGYDTRLRNAEEVVIASGHAAEMCNSLWSVVEQVLQNAELMNMSTCERWDRKYARWLTKAGNPDEQHHDSTSISGR